MRVSIVKKMWPLVVLAFCFLFGILLLLFVIRILNLHNEAMGMNMGKVMMYHHIASWGKVMFWVTMIAIGVGILIWLFIRTRIKR